MHLVAALIAYLCLCHNLNVKVVQLGTLIYTEFLGSKIAAPLRKRPCSAEHREHAQCRPCTESNLRHAAIQIGTHKPR